MRILSFDCAYKSLGVCCAVVELKNNDVISVTIEYIDVLKVADSKDGVEQCTIALKNVLVDLDNRLAQPTHVLIEYQMSANIKSNCVSNQILYHYTGNAITKVIGPSLKNKIAFSDDLIHSVYMAKYASKYTANKRHTRENLIFWLTKRNQQELIANISKSNIDDAADAFMQIYGWLNTKHKLSSGCM